MLGCIPLPFSGMQRFYVACYPPVVYLLLLEKRLLDNLRCHCFPKRYPSHVPVCALRLVSSDEKRDGAGTCTNVCLREMVTVKGWEKSCGLSRPETGPETCRGERAL